MGSPDRGLRLARGMSRVPACGAARWPGCKSGLPVLAGWLGPSELKVCSLGRIVAAFLAASGSSCCWGTAAVLWLGLAVASAAEC